MVQGLRLWLGMGLLNRLGLTEEERAARDAVRGWVRERFMPRITDAHRNSEFPSELIPELAELGLFGANLTGYGCAGMGNVAYGLVLGELERGDSGLRSLCSVQGSLVMYPIFTFGSDAQRQVISLPEVAAGQGTGSRSGSALRTFHQGDVRQGTSRRGAGQSCCTDVPVAAQATSSQATLTACGACRRPLSATSFCSLCP